MLLFQSKKKYFVFPYARWVHIVCALYTPGVAFGDVDRLSLVTLFEMPYSKWGAKVKIYQRFFFFPSGITETFIW